MDRLKAIDGGKQENTAANQAFVPVLGSIARFSGRNNVLSELSPLLTKAQATQSLVQSVRNDPQGFLYPYVKRLVLWVVGPAIAALPVIDENVDSTSDMHPLKALFLEVCILLKHSIPTYLYVSFCLISGTPC